MDKQTAFQTIYDGATNLGYRVQHEAIGHKGSTITLYVYKGEAFSGIHVNLYNDKAHFFLGKTAEDDSLVLGYDEIENIEFVGKSNHAICIHLNSGKYIMYIL